LGAKGRLNPEGQASAQKTALDLANPKAVDVTLTFAGTAQNGTVQVQCGNGAETVFQVRLAGLGDDAIQRAFYKVDEAITQCKTRGPVA
jgi:hypothetical protein